MEEAESEKLLTMQLSLVEEKRRLGDSHPRVKDLENSIEEMSEFLERKRKSVNDPANVAKLGSGTLVAVYSKMLEKDLEDIQRQVKEIKNGIATEEEAAVALVADELKNENMKEELDRTKSLQMAVIEWLRQRSMMEGQGGFITEVLAAPQYGEKSWPKLPIVLAASLCLGLFGGSSLALLVDLSDSSFRSTAEIEQVVGAPLIGALPTTKFLKGKNGETSISAEVVTFHQPMSVASESYRQVRTSLMFRADGKPLNLLQFTSPNPGDGKTLTAVNVANSLAQTGKRVLLVDCDLRRPRVGSLFGLSEVKGLSEVLREACELDEAIHATKAARLSVMPSGQTPSNPAELLQSHAFQNLLEVVREKFDIVVVDSPPLLAVSEATSLAQSVDGVVICLRTENTTRPEADRAIRLLQGVGVTPLGFVVNDIDRLVSQGDEEKYSGKYYGRKHMKYFEPTRTDRADSNKA